MANVYVEPKPKARAEHEPVSYYALEYKHDERVTPTNYSTQHEAVAEAKALGHHPLIARVRVTDKGNPDHWRSA